MDKTQLAQTQAQSHLRSTSPSEWGGANSRTTSHKMRPGSHWTRHLTRELKVKDKGLAACWERGHYEGLFHSPDHVHWEHQKVPFPSLFTWSIRRNMYNTPAFLWSHCLPYTGNEARSNISFSHESTKVGVIDYICSLQTVQLH